MTYAASHHASQTASTRRRKRPTILERIFGKGRMMHQGWSRSSKASEPDRVELAEKGFFMGQ